MQETVDVDLRSRIPLGARPRTRRESPCRYRASQRPCLREYADRYPEFAGEIRQVFPAMAMIENIALADGSLDGDRHATRAAPPVDPDVEK